MSEHKNLAEALVAFQSEAPKLFKGSEAKAGSFSYKYVDLADLVETIRPLMAAHGLSFSAFPCADEHGKPALRYKLTHRSGDCESSVMPLMLSKADAQALGSAISYARRYALTAVLNLVADADDDGAAASQAAQRAARATNGNGPPQRQPLPDASVKIVLDAIKEAARGQEWLRGELVALGVESVPDGPVTKGTIQSLTPAQANELVAKCEKARA